MEVVLHKLVKTSKNQHWYDERSSSSQRWLPPVLMAGLAEFDRYRQRDWCMHAWLILSCWVLYSTFCFPSAPWLCEHSSDCAEHFKDQWSDTAVCETQWISSDWLATWLIYWAWSCCCWRFMLLVPAEVNRNTARTHVLCSTGRLTMVVLCRHLFEDTRALRTCVSHQIHRSLLPICVPVGLQHILNCWAMSGPFSVFDNLKHPAGTIPSWSWYSWDLRAPSFITWDSIELCAQHTTGSKILLEHGFW